MAEPIEMPFGDSGGPKEACFRWGAHWRHLRTTSEPSMCVGDAAFLSNYFHHLLLLGRIAVLRYAAYCYRPSSAVCRFVCGSVCRSVCQSVILVSPTKTAEPIPLPFGFRTRVGQGNHVFDGVQIPPAGRDNFRRKGRPL